MVLGITGGVGCGKSTLLSMLEKKKGAKISAELVSNGEKYKTVSFIMNILSEIKNGMDENLELL